MFRHKNVIHVEVAQRFKSACDRGTLLSLVDGFVRKNIVPEQLPHSWSGIDELQELHPQVEIINVTLDGTLDGETRVDIHLYKLKPPCTLS